MPWRSDGQGERRARRKAQQEVNRYAQAGLRQLRRSVPVDTGRMRAQCRVEAGTLASPTTVRSAVDYAPYVAGYRRAVLITRAYVRQQLRPFTVRARFTDEEGHVRQEDVRIAPSRAFRVGGGRLAVTIRHARRFRFRINANGRPGYTATF